MPNITPIIPQSIDEIARVAKGVCASGLAPKGMNTEAQIMVAIMHGLEIGLPPMQAIQKIAVINGRPSIWGDAIPSLLLAKGFRISEEAIENGHKCTITRPDGAVTTRQFTKAQAVQAGLWGKPGPWKQYPDRMLQMRARSLAARDGAADCLAGMYLAEEAQDIPAEAIPGDNVIDITPDADSEWLDFEQLQERPNRPTKYAYQKDGGDETYSEVTGQIADCDSADKLDQIPDLYRDELDAMPNSYVKHIVDQLINKEQELTNA